MPAYINAPMSVLAGRSKRSRPAGAVVTEPAEGLVREDDCGAAEAAAAAQRAHLESAVSALLAGLGEDITRDGIRDTPTVRRRNNDINLVCGPTG